VAHRQWLGEAATKGNQVTDSQTRRDLERAVRTLIPSELTTTKTMNHNAPLGAATGVGGLLTGYVWGWLRVRKSRHARKNRSK
jgi:hypothetical protein